MNQAVTHIGVDTVYHCANCNHHHCILCGICHRCGCETYKPITKERKKKRQGVPEVRYNARKYKGFPPTEKLMSQLEAATEAPAVTWSLGWRGGSHGDICRSSSH